MFRNIIRLIKIIIVIGVFVVLYQMITEEKDPKQQWYKDECYSIEWRLYPTQNGEWKTDIINGYNKDIVIIYEVKTDKISIFRMVEIESGKTTGPQSVKLKDNSDAWIEIETVFVSENGDIGEEIPCLSE